MYVFEEYEERGKVSGDEQENENKGGVESAETRILTFSLNELMTFFLNPVLSILNIVKTAMPFLFGSCVGGVGERFQLSPASRLRMPLGTKYYLAAFPLCPS